MKSMASLELESPASLQPAGIRQRALFSALRQVCQFSFKPMIALVICSALNLGLADQIQMRNGDQYFGKVLSLNEQTLVVQSDVLGTIRLPRAKVAYVDVGAGLPANKPVALTGTNELPHAVSPSLTNAPGDFAAAMRQLGSSSNALQQIETQLLNEGGPEAKQKFNELLGGFLTGKLSISDIRAQAQTTADQVRSLRKDLGDDAGSMIDSYLAILDSFLKETAPAKSPTTNSAAAPVKPKSKVAVDE